MVFVPHCLDEHSKVGQCMRCGEDEKIGTLERVGLHVEIVAHQVQPGAGEILVVPDLLRTAAVSKELRQGLMVPVILVLEDHRHSLEIAAARRGVELCMERDQCGSSLRHPYASGV